MILSVRGCLCIRCRPLDAFGLGQPELHEKTCHKHHRMQWPSRPTLAGERFGHLPSPSSSLSQPRVHGTLESSGEPSCRHPAFPGLVPAANRHRRRAPRLIQGMHRLTEGGSRLRDGCVLQGSALRRLHERVRDNRTVGHGARSWRSKKPSRFSSSQIASSRAEADGVNRRPSATFRSCCSLPSDHLAIR